MLVLLVACLVACHVAAAARHTSTLLQYILIHPIMTAATTTFTSNFINRIEESRHNLNTYITTTKNKSNDICSKLQQEQHTEQENIDILLRQLKSLQHERGVVSAANNNSNKANSGGDGGLVEQRKKLENKQLQFEEEVHLLTSKNRVDQEQLDGACIYMYCLFCYQLSIFMMFSLASSHKIISHTYTNRGNSRRKGNTSKGK